MDTRRHNELENVVEWLFERVPERFAAQVGYATAQKKALIWLPGRKAAEDSNVEWGGRVGEYGGCTQTAWETWRVPVQSQPGCFIAWLGYDVDLDTLEEQLDAIRRVRDTDLPFSIRCSAGGTGLHLILRLDQPVWSPGGYHSTFLRSLGRVAYDELTNRGVHICSSGYRMFWLVGGNNKWISVCDDLYLPPHIDLSGVASNPIPQRTSAAPAQFAIDEKFAQHVNVWLERFHEAGVMRGARIGGNPVYVGAVIAVLRAHGETVHTKSPCSGNGNINGFIDIGADGNSISLWSYADGHNIWTWNEGCIVCG
jgi:hypothetical protein